MAGWRPMQAADLATVTAVADVVHVNYPEDPAVFADRLALFAPGCLMAEEDGRVLGYCISHPGIVGQPPPLDTVLGALPAGCDCLYIHDVALLPAARGRHLGVAVARLLENVARVHGFGRMALTAVNGSDGFWGALGYLPQPCAKLASYGEATYRVKPLA
ncbi:MAG TPA: GNAT family N-acetyltransferase [Magnetospirillum sp.]|nr:GNAT family N-acetyltransferase [Magnetospirillum sp.]